MSPREALQKILDELESIRPCDRMDLDKDILAIASAALAEADGQPPPILCDDCGTSRGVVHIETRAPGYAKCDECACAAWERATGADR